MANLTPTLAGRWLSALIIAAGCLGVSVLPVPGAARTPKVDFSDVPRDLQLYPRDRATGIASLFVAGTVNEPGFDQVIVHVTRAGVEYTNVTQHLTYIGEHAAFWLKPGIMAELAGYDFKIALVNSNGEVEVASATNVVGGDVFLINGQSNAEAGRYDGSANGEQSPYVRSFGTRTESPDIVSSDRRWYIAEGDQFEGPGAIGQWGLHLGRLIVDTYRIPVLIINGAKGGKQIAYYQRNTVDPLDLSGNYGRLLSRARQARVDGAVRAIFWYQGESDNDDASSHEHGFIRLYQDWQKQFPTLEKTYVFQVRVGCGVSQWSVGLRNAQRLLADRFPGIEVLSTTGLDGHFYQDKLAYCHFGYTNGYEVLGRNAFNLTARDLYGAAPRKNIEAPDIAYAYFSKPAHDEITLVMRQSQDEFVWHTGAEADFRVEGGDVDVDVTGGAVSNNRVVLTLSAPVGTNATLAYAGHDDAGRWVANASGIGLLCFCKQKIHDTGEISAAMADFRADALGTEPDFAAAREEVLTVQTIANETGGNLIRNPGFQDLNGDGVFGDGWVTTGNVAFLNYFPNGNPGHATFFSDLTGNSGSVYYPGLVVTNGARYRFTIDAAFEANWNATISFGLQFMADDGATVVTQKMVPIHTPNPTVTTYRPYVMAAAAPASATYVRPCIMFTNSVHGEGKLQSAEFDNCVLTVETTRVHPLAEISEATPARIHDERFAPAAEAAVENSTELIDRPNSP